MKKQTKQDFIIIGSILLFLLLGLIVYINLNDKTGPFKTIIKNTFTYVNKINDSVKNVPDLTSDYKVYLELSNSNETLKLNLDYSPKNKYIKLDGNLNDNDLTYIFKDNKSYLKSTKLNNTYNINYQFKGCNDTECLDNVGSLDDIIANGFLTSNINYKDLNRTIANLEKAFLKSIDKRYITKKKMTTIINNVDTKTTRYSYLLNKNSLSILLNNINHNKTLKDDIFNLFGDSLNATGITKDNFKDIIGTKDNFGTLNIYMIGNRIAKVNLSIVEGINITVNIDDNLTTIEYTLSNEISGKITVNNNTHKTNIAYYYKGNNSIVLDASMENKLLSIDYNIYVGSKKYTGTMSNETLEDSNDSLKGILKINDITLKYDLKALDNLAKDEITNYTKDFNDNDKKALEDIISAFENDNLIKGIIEEIKALEN